MRAAGLTAQGQATAAAPQILFVEDEAPFRSFAGRYLEDRGFALSYAEGGREALARFAEAAPDLVLLDLNLPDQHGLDVLRQLRARRPDQRVVVLTAYGDAATAVKALKGGATDYLTKPVRLDQLVVAVNEALSSGPPTSTGAPGAVEAATPARGLARAAPPGEAPVGRHPAWLAVLDRLARVAESGISSLLLLGESGTGKSALARHFHSLAAAGEAPFVQIDCPSIPEALLESELFGHEKGAFTGATARKRGQVELAAGGTLFLDEIGELPLLIQPKLLRFLEQRRFRRVGGLEDLEANVRLVCATNRELRRDVEQGSFRTDLYYRLEVVALELPPLRDRGEDVLLLAEHYVKAFTPPGRAPVALSDASREALRAHAFPGNVRELRNMIQRAVAFSAGEVLEPSDLDLAPSAGGGRCRAVGGPPAPVDLDPLLDALESHYLLQASARTESQREAGSLLGIDRFAVARRTNRTLRLGGAEEVSRLLSETPVWLRGILGQHPTELPRDGLDLPALRADLEGQAIAFALEATEGNRAKAATLLGLSRTTLLRRLEARGK